MQIRHYLADLYADGMVFDEQQADRLMRRRNLEPDTARLVWSMLITSGARNVVEIGTSNGFSTLWWADAMARTGGVVTSVDTNDEGLHQAEQHLHSLRLGAYASLVHADAADFLPALADESVDVLFLDAERTEYPRWWPHPLRVVRTGGLLLLDNAISHAEELTPFVDLVDQVDTVDRQLIPVGKGLQVILKLSAGVAKRGHHRIDG